MNANRVARGLAWFGIGLGLIEVIAPRSVGRAAGLEEYADLIRSFGFREIGSGLVVLTAERPQAALWTRVLGDGFDGALLARGLSGANPLRQRTLAAALAVAPVVALDVVYAFRRGARS